MYSSSPLFTSLFLFFLSYSTSLILSNCISFWLFFGPSLWILQLSRCLSIWRLFCSMLSHILDCLVQVLENLKPLSLHQHRCSVLAILSHMLRMSGAGAGEPEAPVPAPAHVLCVGHSVTHPKNVWCRCWRTWSPCPCTSTGARCWPFCHTS